MTIKRGGHTFQGVDKPIRTPGHSSGKSHAVVIKQGDGFRLIRFGMQGAKTKRPRKGESDADKAKRKSFKARHAKNIAKGKTSAAYWADKVKWSDYINKYYDFLCQKSLLSQTLLLNNTQLYRKNYKN